MHKLNGNVFLSDIIKRYPQALEVFVTNGFEDFADNDGLFEISPFIKLKTILKERNINENTFIALLEDKINGSANNGSYFPPELETTDRMNLLALLPCPLKLPLQEAFTGFLHNTHFSETNHLNYLIEGNANNQLSYNSYVEQFEDIDEIPDIVISPGINSFYYKNFVDKFVDKGLFVDAAQYMPNHALSKVGIKDPGSNYTIFCMNLLVMVVDRLKLGNTPVPKTWGDLLNPEFEKRVAIRGHKDSFCETTLLTIFKGYGIDGVRKLGKSVKYGWHPAQMVKAAGSGGSDCPAVSVMPYFFTRTIKYKENVHVVWPEDGAIVSPVTMLVKAEKAKQLTVITDFFTSAKVGKICAGAYFPSLHPDVDSKIPEDARYNWIGWDFIKGNDVGHLIKGLNSEFVKSFRGG